MRLTRWSPLVLRQLEGESSECARFQRATVPISNQNSDVGTGLLLGGGLSFLSPKHGFGADTFVELDVVLVNGRLVTATVDNQYSDLFKAMKGGANRLGIVTRYEVTAVRTGRRQDKQWFGGVILVNPAFHCR